MSPEMEAPKLIEVLQEMKNSLDSVNEQIRILTKQVKDNQILTADGISYLETKHLLMLSYCQSIVYYVLRKAKGLSIQNHPLVQSFVEVKLFIEKIRPIDKKFDYQVQKLLKLAGNANNNNMDENTKEIKEVNNNGEDLSKFRPNPDMLVAKFNVDDQADGLYRVPKFAPTSMDADKLSKDEKMAKRREKELLHKSESSSYWKGFLDDFEDKPEELDNSVVPDSIEVSRYLSKRREQASQEEEFFFRAPVTKREKQHERKLMRKSRNGMTGLTDGFEDVLKLLPQKSKDDAVSLTTMTSASKGKGFKGRKTALSPLAASGKTRYYNSFALSYASSRVAGLALSILLEL